MKFFWESKLVGLAIFSALCLYLAAKIYPIVTGSEYPAHRAIERHDLTELKLLVAKGHLEEIEEGFKGGCTTPLTLAALRNDKEAVDLLLDSGADIHLRGCGINILAAGIRHPDLISHLIKDRGIDPIKITPKENPRARGTDNSLARALKGDPDGLAVIRTKGINGDKLLLIIISEMYEKGIGVSKDLVAAKKWYAEYLDQLEIDNIFKAIDYKKGTPAFDQMKEKAEAGNKYAQYYLGRIFWFGLGHGADRIEPERETAIKWYLMAANQGFQKAQEELAHLYQGIDKTYKADGAFYYRSGHVPIDEDYIQAYKWYGILAVESKDSGDALSRTVYSEVREFSGQRDYMAKQLTESQIQQAKRLVTEWKPAASLSAEDKK